MGKLIRVVGAILLGIALGLFITARSLAPDRVGVAVGPWQSQPRDGSGEMTPYALASTARAGLLPLGAGEGMSFVAKTDSSGAPFVGGCDYLLKGPMPTARYWTLSLLSPEGFPIANPASRFTITSSEVLRFNDEPVMIVIAPNARAGNWLSTGNAGRYVLMLRLYDTGLSTVGAILTTTALPSLQKETCR